MVLVEDALAHLECRKVDRHDAGDHAIYVGEGGVDGLRRGSATDLLTAAGTHRSSADPVRLTPTRRRVFEILDGPGTNRDIRQRAMADVGARTRFRGTRSRR